MNLARPRPLGRHPPGATATTKTRTTSLGALRLRHGQSAVQRRRGRQGAGSTATRASRSASPGPTTRNYLWIQIFYSALNDDGPRRLRHGELGGRRPRHPSRRSAGSSIETGAVDVMVAVGSNFFYTVTLPCTLWFLDKGKSRHASARTGAVHRRPPHLPPDRPRPPRLPARADRVPRQHRAPVSRRGRSRPIDGQRARSLKEHVPRRHLRRRPGPLQGRDPSRDRGAGLEPQPRPLRRRRRRVGERRGLQGAVRGAERGTGDS